MSGGGKPRRAVWPLLAVAVFLAAALLAGCGLPWSSTGALTSQPSASPLPPPAKVTPEATAVQTESGSSGLVVFDGDSLTYGFGAPVGRDYPSFAMEQLPSWLHKVNVAVNGQVWPDLLADAQTQVDGLYSPQRRHNLVVVWCGTNDLIRTHGPERTWRDAARYCSERRARGFTVVLLTILATSPRDLDPYYEANRRTLNDLIRKHWPEVADALVDIARDPRIGDPAGGSAAIYYSDGVHHNAAGNEVIADAVAARIQELLATPAPSASPSSTP